MSSILNQIYIHIAKRWLDLLLSLLLILLLFPLFLMISFMLFLKYGHVFFIQKRPGLNHQIFSIYKFRTMHDLKNESDENLSDEQRVHAVGRVLRKTHLDELPQLVNILIGDMSIVGPRPLFIEYLAKYSTKELRRHKVKPGITGWAQINGGSTLNLQEKLKFDLGYVERVSFLFDMKILKISFYNIFSGRGFEK